jgi:tetraprenyl-beta-curcumene synthase
MVANALGDRRLVARAGLALALANARYWTSVAPIVRRELRRWESRARAIPDPELRALALWKLHGEGFHAEAAAMLATLAPRSRRDSVVEAIVALELMFDYLDGLTERPSRDPLLDGERLFAALFDAVAVGSASTAVGFEPERTRDGGYLEMLSRTVSSNLGPLPSVLEIAAVVERTVQRSARAQIQMHAIGEVGVAPLEEWATTEANGSALGWRELAAGAASSVLVVHALIAAGADTATTREDAEQIATAYLPTCVVLTLLDGLVDYRNDTNHDGSRRPGYLDLYDDPSELPDVLADAARRARTLASALPNGPHHVMLLAGVVAYYGSAPGADSELAGPVVARLREELRPLVSPTLAIMRGWRAARRGTRLFGAKGEGES